MPKFRKKPVVVEAMRVPPLDSDDRIVLNDWLMRKQAKYICRNINDDVEIFTLEAAKITYAWETAEDKIPKWYEVKDNIAYVGDWIICGIAGELYPCKDPIFQESYEKVE